MSAFADFTTICMYLFLPLQFWDEFFGFLKSMRGPPFPSRPHPKPWLAVISPLSPPPPVVVIVVLWEGGVLTGFRGKIGYTKEFSDCTKIRAIGSRFSLFRYFTLFQRYGTKKAEKLTYICEYFICIKRWPLRCAKRADEKVRRHLPFFVPINLHA